MRIYYIRHGEPNYELGCLTEKGKQEAKITAEFFANIKIDKIFSSTVNRAMETAKYTADILNLPITKMESCLTEIYAGQIFSEENEKGEKNWMFSLPKYMKEFKRLAYDPNWLDDPFIARTKIPLGIKTINTAVDNLLLSIGVEHDRKSKTYSLSKDSPETIAIFAHGGLGTAFIPSILDIPYPLYVTTFNILSTCGIVVIDIDDNSGEFRSRLIKFNFTNYEGEKIYGERN